MWFKTLLLAGSLALSVGVAPTMAAPRQGSPQQQLTLVGDHHGGRGRDHDEDRAQNTLSIREVADILRSRFGGQLNSGRLEGGDRPFYVIRWEMPNGDYRDFTVDAVTGQIR